MCVHCVVSIGTAANATSSILIWLQGDIRLVHILTKLVTTPRHLLQSNLLTKNYHLKMILYAYLESLLFKMLPCSHLCTLHLRLDIGLLTLVAPRM